MNTRKSIIMMGVSGTGKTTIGIELAKSLNTKFIDGDDLHPRDNIWKMRKGQALDDNDREPWLERLSDVVFSVGQKSESVVLVCSALKKRYRDKLRLGNPHVVFIWLKGDFDCVLARIKSRKGHFMPEELLQSQFNTLEQPDSSEHDIIAIEIMATIDYILQECVSRINECELSQRSDVNNFQNMSNC